MLSVQAWWPQSVLMTGERANEQPREVGAFGPALALIEMPASDPSDCSWRLRTGASVGFGPPDGMRYATVAASPLAELMTRFALAAASRDALDAFEARMADQIAA